MKTDKPSVIAVIPARGGSKRVPDKNLALFRGKPLVSHTIEQAMKAGCFDQIILSSDDMSIIDAVKPYPIEISRRDQRLATDNATIIDVIRNLAENYHWNNNSIIGLLQVTAPLRSVKDILQAFELFISSGRSNAVVSVALDEHPIHLSWYLNDGGKLTPMFPEIYKRGVRKQDQKATYHWNDAVMFDSVKNILRPDRNLFGSSPIPYVMPGERSVNIDYDFQLEICQSLSRN